MMEKVHGVNLGNWLVLEKWMQPEVFAGVEAEDETDLCQMLPRSELEQRLKQHRDTFITLDDFRWIAEHGINTVRIPVPHFIFGDDPAFCDPYVPCIEYLDQAFVWAKETKLKILIDLHTVPDSQNGFDNGGICGVCKFAQKPENEARAVKVLGMLANRYAQEEALWGIQILNEPISEELWTIIQSRYQPRDPERAQGSDFVSLEFLFDFYTKAYHEIRKYLPEDKVVMFHDGFRLKAWKEFMQTAEFKNVWLDTHIYVGMATMIGESFQLSRAIRSILEDYTNDIQELSQYFPVVVGEWSLSCDMTLEDQVFSRYTPVQKKMAYRALADAQLLAWDSGAGYFFWSYKVPSEPDGWSFRSSVEKGWITKNVSQE